MSLATSWRKNLFCFRIDLLLLGLDLETILWPNAFQAPCQWLATVFKPAAAEVRDHQPCDHWLPWRRVRGRVSLEVSFDVCVCVCLGVAIKDLDSKRNVKSTCWHIYIYIHHTAFPFSYVCIRCLPRRPWTSSFISVFLFFPMNIPNWKMKIVWVNQFKKARKLLTPFIRSITKLFPNYWGCARLTDYIRGVKPWGCLKPN